MKSRIAILLLLTLTACASRPLPPPYPAYVVVDELPDAFVASLPGVRAKQLSLDPRTQRVSYRLAVPPDWSFTTGGSPIHSVEIYVLAGQVDIGEFSLADVGGWQVILAESGADALTKLEQSVPDVILTDVLMPVMDGPTLLSRLRQQQSTARVPVIIMTAKAQDSDRYLALGASGVIIKPFDPMKLPGQVRQIVGEIT